MEGSTYWMEGPILNHYGMQHLIWFNSYLENSKEERILLCNPVHILLKQNKNVKILSNGATRTLFYLVYYSRWFFYTVITLFAG